MRPWTAVAGVVLALAGMSVAGCSPQRSAEGVDAGGSMQPSASGSAPVQGWVEATQLCVENNSSMSVFVSWKNASLGHDDDGLVPSGEFACGRGDSNGDYGDDVVASIVIDAKTTVLAAGDNEAFQRPSVAIQDLTTGSYQCFDQRAYLDMGKSATFRFGGRLDDGVAGFEMRREGLEATMKEMRVAIYDTQNPAPDIRSRKCDW